jgi:hypothetical protein
MAPLLVKPVYMIRRDKFGRYQRQERWRQIIGYSILGGILLGVGLGIAGVGEPYTYIKEAEAATSTPEEIKVMLVLDYSDPKDIEKLIRDTFVEEPNTAVAVAKAEGGLRTEVQSHYIKNGIREPSYCAFQIHAPSWDREAKRLGYADYRINVEHCVKMARHIYKQHGWQPWSAYKNGSYKAKL